ncbi:hypothetical protein [Paenibacillus ferrarius]|uniref:hypothetical protein n=1 Tax=Paenibacillus ferrarius TaxID=1469647 RepID=UPI001FCA2CFE|nr:hypothetical protein [Paenibacillus ferrarius]
MKVFIKNGFDNQIANHNFYAAYDGFKQMGFEILYFENIEELTENNKEDIIVGYVDDVRTTLSKYSIVPPEIDYPEET